MYAFILSSAGDTIWKNARATEILAQIYDGTKDLLLKAKKKKNN